MTLITGTETRCTRKGAPFEAYERVYLFFGIRRYEAEGGGYWGTPLLSSLDDISELRVMDDVGMPVSMDPSKLVIDERHSIKVVITYPCKTSTLTIHQSKPITLRTFCKAVYDAYRLMYAEEERTATIRGTPASKALNRRATNGRYGIWGHDLNDLFFEGAERDRDGIWKLYIGS